MNLHESQPNVSVDAPNTAPHDHPEAVSQVKRDEGREAPLDAYYAAPETVNRKVRTRTWPTKYTIWLGLIGFTAGILLAQPSLMKNMQNSWVVDALLVIVMWVGAVLGLFQYRQAKEPDGAHLPRYVRLMGWMSWNIITAAVTVYWILKHPLKLFH